MQKLVGRKKELATLEGLKNENKSSFVAVYGRRRVGKTFLIRHAFANQFHFHLTGMANVNTAQQLTNFSIAFQKLDVSNESQKPPESWQEAFQRLIKWLEKQDNKKKIIFLDELPWLDTLQSGFIPALEHFWNGWASAREDIILVVCGSAAAWMINKLINNTGGLHNRVTHRIRLDPFTLQECEAFFEARSASFDRYQIIQLYMAMGGIPFYLDQVNPGFSADQNIDKLCFTKDGILRGEFNNLFHSLFQKAERHISIIEALSKKARGLTRDELLVASGMPNGGGTTRILKELEESHFIRRYEYYGNKSKLSLYQLSDPYSLFYMHWIKDTSMLDENNWINQLDSPQKRAWSGYAFEQVCLEHLPQIKKALGISVIQNTVSSWTSRNDHQGAQVDLVIDRRDRIINLCEMKFSIHPFTITKKYAEELATKIQTFRDETKTTKSIYLTMITTFGVASNNYASAMVKNNFTMDILFEP